MLNDTRTCNILLDITVRKLSYLVALMLDIVDVFIWYPDTKGRRLHSFVVHSNSFLGH
jgi:hypothetical protein